jgi:nucleotide-binding universal stress UspA family protein
VLPIQTILHATDFSPPADFALQFAAALARDCGARLIVLHVGVPPLRNLGGPVPVPPLAEEWGRKDLSHQLRQRTATGVAVEHRLAFAESAGDEIRRVADEVNCGLIVLGTHGRTGLDRLLLGSVAEHVVRKARQPVLTVKQPLPRAEHASEAAIVGAAAATGSGR